MRIDLQYKTRARFDMVRCLFPQQSAGWSYNRTQLQGSIWCCVYVFKKTFGWSYNIIQLHSSIWWSVYIHKKYQDGVTIEDSNLMLLKKIINPPY